MNFEVILNKIRDQISAIEASWILRRDANGCRYLFIPAPYDQFFFSVTYRAGSRYETEEIAGISHLLEHMMFRGSDKFPNFINLAKEFETFGGEWNAETGQEFTSYWYFGTSLGHEDILPLFREFLEKPKLADLEREKSIVLREIDEEINEHGEFVDMDYHMASIFWPRSSLALPITGTHESVRDISLQNLIDFKNKHYRTDTAFVTLICPEDLGLAENLMPFLQPSGKSQDAQPLKPLAGYSGPKLKIVENTDGQCSVQIAFLCQNPDDVKSPEKLELLSMILSSGFTSRMSYTIREKMGLVYDIAAHVHKSQDYCYLMIEANVNYDLLNNFFKAVFDLLNNLKKEGVTEREVNLAKLKYASSILHNVHSPTSAVDLAYNHYASEDPPTSITAFADRIISSEKKDLERCFSELLNYKNMGLVILGQAEKIDISNLQKLIPGLSLSYSINSSPL